MQAILYLKEHGYQKPEPFDLAELNVSTHTDFAMHELEE